MCEENVLNKICRICINMRLIYVSHMSHIFCTTSCKHICSAYANQRYIFPKFAYKRQVFAYMRHIMYNYMPHIYRTCAGLFAHMLRIFANMCCIYANMLHMYANNANMHREHAYMRWYKICIMAMYVIAYVICKFFQNLRLMLQSRYCYETVSLIQVYSHTFGEWCAIWYFAFNYGELRF